MCVSVTWKCVCCSVVAVPPVCSAVFAVAAPLVWPDVHTFGPDTVLNTTVVCAVHLVAAVASLRRVHVVLVAYVAWLLYCLSDALFQWWLPYVFNVVSAVRVVHLREVCLWWSWQPWSRSHGPCGF